MTKIIPKISDMYIMENKEQQTKPEITTIKSIYRAIVEKAMTEPAYFAIHKPLSDARYTLRDKKGLGLQLRMSA
ncbi:MAG: hypothetical protein OIF32_06580 [Campylobacterales bacterium]|nr:hypothetical protein [Campylobacterales bacterium]